MNDPRFPLAKGPAGDLGGAQKPEHGLQSHVWEGRFGSIQIDVAGDQVFVNGQRVEPAEPSPQAQPRRSK